MLRRMKHSSLVGVLPSLNFTEYIPIRTTPRLQRSPSYVNYPIVPISLLSRNVSYCRIRAMCHMARESSDVKYCPTKVLSQQSRDVTYSPTRAISQLSRDITYCPIRALSKQSRDDVTFCRDRGYLTTHVKPLPRLCRLSDNVPRAFVNYARTDQLDEMKRMVQVAEERGDGVGKGEFTVESERSDCLFNRSEIFSVTLDRKSSPLLISLEASYPATEVDAFISISPCLYADTYDPCLATVHVFRSSWLAADDRTYRSLVHLAVQLTDEINCGYTHAVVDVALCHVNLLRQLKDEGFHVTAIIPNCIYVNGVGACENVILVKHFQKTDRPARSLTTVLEMLERVDPSEEFLRRYHKICLPQLPCLPLIYTFDNGIEATFRMMRKEEDDKLFSLMTESVKQGQGFGVNEYPFLDYFRKHRLTRGPTIVIEDTTNHHIIGFLNISDSRFTRGWKTGAEDSLVVNPNYRNKGIATEIVHILGSLVREAGYSRCVENMFISNQRAKAAVEHTASKKSGYVGTLPNAGYVDSGLGWEDMLIFHANNEDLPTFSHLVADKAKKRIINSSKL